ncbi:MAG: hypothetical protein RIR94_1703 [Bacteroidota bacterium]|jgi:hypothetical protein
MRLRKKPFLSPILNSMSKEFSPLNDNGDPSLRLSKRKIEVLKNIAGMMLYAIKHGIFEV